MRVRQRRQHLCHFTPLPYISASFTLCLITYTYLCPSLFLSNMYLFVFWVFAWIAEPLYLRLAVPRNRSVDKNGNFKSIFLKSQQLRESGVKKNSVSAAAVVNILDFKGNTAGVQRKIILIGHRPSFSLCIETCAGRYTYIDTVQAEALHHTSWTLKMISPRVFWLEQSRRSKCLLRRFFSYILWEKFLVSQMSSSEFDFLL